MIFGIHPGGAVGTIGSGGRPKAEHAGKRLAALRELRGNRPFVVHLYDSYTTSADGSALPSGLAEQIDSYAANGFEVELVLAYRPAIASGDVDGFVDFVRRRVRQLGANPSVTALQVTNEANINGSASATDGFYPGARDALIQGTIAARDEADRRGYRRLKLGFNWAYHTGPGEKAFWRYLGEHGGARLTAAVDWIGLDVYPGTWGPTIAGELATGVHDFMLQAIRTLRATYMPLADIGGSVPIRVCEGGYPTGPGRSDAAQVTVMRSLVRAVLEASRTYNISDFRWFDLRDSDSSAPSFEAQYGIMRDDYAPKPAFRAYRDLVAAS